MTAIPTAGVHHIALTVSDVRCSQQFYIEAIAGDVFTENCIGLDHLSLSVASMAELDAALALLDARGVPHGDILRLEP